MLAGLPPIADGKERPDKDQKLKGTTSTDKSTHDESDTDAKKLCSSAGEEVPVTQFLDPNSKLLSIKN